MGINTLYTIIAIICGICTTLLLVTEESIFTMPCFVAIIIGGVFSLTTIETLNSELIIEEYLRSSYDSSIKEEDISSILKSYDKGAKLLDIETYEIPNSKSLYIRLDIRAGKYIYRDLEYKYTVGVDNDKVFIKKGD